MNDLIPGVDYDESCCALCGRTDMHDHPQEEYGTFDFDDEPCPPRYQKGTR